MAKSISQIRDEFEQASNLEELFALYETDTRKGVISLVQKYKKQIEKLEIERKRLELMHQFEYKYSDYEFICGIDEAGRGPLAGPVVAGAVILPKDCEILYLNDSKKLSPSKRDALYDEIADKALCWAVGESSPERIDEINILQATYEAMRKAIAKLSISPDLLLCDAVSIPEVSMKQVGIIRGDAKSVSIAAASIMAKVTRDRYMISMAEKYPEYGFEGHKGYGSSSHIDAIKKYGPCPIHRKTFIKNFVS